MLVNQIAVFIENRRGRLCTMLEALSAAGINVENLNIADTNDFGIVRMITNDNAKAVAVLAKAGFTSAAADLVAVEVPNVPGSLVKTISLLSEGGVNLEYVYSYSRAEGKALILIKTDNPELAQKLLK